MRTTSDRTSAALAGLPDRRFVAPSYLAATSLLLLMGGHYVVEP